VRRVIGSDRCHDGVALVEGVVRLDLLLAVGDASTGVPIDIDSSRGNFAGNSG
jgi:hypothetical protein